MNKLCPKCASVFSDESVFCNKCGAKLIEYEIKDENKDEDIVFSRSDDIHGDAKKIPQVSELYHKNEESNTPEEKNPRDLHKKAVKKNDKDSTQEFDISHEIESMNKPAENNTVKKKICPECGAEIPYDSAVCPACKKRLHDGYDDNDTGERSKSSVSLTIIITVLIIAVIIVGIVIAVILTSGNRAPGASGSSRVQSSAAVSAQSSSEDEYTEPEETDTEETEPESYTEQSSEELIVQSSEEPAESSDEAAESSALDESSYEEESTGEPAESSLEEQSYESETTDESSEEEPVESSEGNEESTVEESEEVTTE